MKDGGGKTRRGATRRSRIDIEDVTATLRRHADHLRDELDCTEKAIDMLGRIDVPVLFPAEEGV